MQTFNLQHTTSRLACAYGLCLCDGVFVYTHSFEMRPPVLRTFFGFFFYYCVLPVKTNITLHCTTGCCCFSCRVLSLLASCPCDWLLQMCFHHSIPSAQCACKGLLLNCVCLSFSLSVCPPQIVCIFSTVYDIHTHSP